MSDLPAGVHTAVRAAGTDERDRMVGDLAQRLFHALLDRRPVSLPLPATEAGAVVFNPECIAHGVKPF